MLPMLALGSRTKNRYWASGKARPKNLLSGFLACGECGGGFYRADNRGTYVCGHRRDRGASVCGNSLRVRQSDLEDRILGVIQSEILVPEHIAYAVEKALALAKERTASYDASPDTERLDAIDAEQENLIRMAAQLSKLGPYGRILEGLEVERGEIKARLEHQPVPIDPEALRAPIEARLRDLSGWLADRGGDSARQALDALLAGSKLRVSPDPDRDFRVDGILRVAVKPSGSDPLGGDASGRTYRPPATT